MSLAGIQWSLETPSGTRNHTRRIEGRNKYQKKVKLKCMAGNLPKVMIAKRKKKKTKVLHVDENGIKSTQRGLKANFLQKTMYV